MCGGSWYHIPNLSRSAFRGNINPDDRDSKFGFRVVSTPNFSPLTTTSFIEPLTTTPSLNRVDIPGKDYSMSIRLTKRYPLHGGSWYSLPSDCRSVSRIHSEPGSSLNNYGFRVVCNE